MSLRPITGPSPQSAPTATSSSGLVQPLFDTQIATSDSTGAISFKYPAVFSGQILIGSFSCPAAPYTAQFTAYNNQQEVYSWQSSNNPGPLRVAENQAIEIKGTGLVPNTQYVMNWVGYSTTSGHAPQIVPHSHSDVVIATNQGGLKSASISAAGSVQILPAPPAGFAYRIHSISLTNFFGTPASVQDIVFIYETSVPPSRFFMTIIPATLPFAQTFLFNGLLVSNSIVGNDITTGSVSWSYYVRYDLIQI